MQPARIFPTPPARNSSRERRIEESEETDLRVSSITRTSLHRSRRSRTRDAALRGCIGGRAYSRGGIAARAETRHDSYFESDRWCFARRTGETDWTRCRLNPYRPPTTDLSPLAFPLRLSRLGVATSFSIPTAYRLSRPTSEDYHLVGPNTGETFRSSLREIRGSSIQKSARPFFFRDSRRESGLIKAKFRCDAVPPQWRHRGKITVIGEEPLDGFIARNSAPSLAPRIARVR